MATDVRTQEQLRNPRIDEGIYNAWQRQWLKITTAQGDQNAFELKTAPAGGIPQLVTGVRTGEDVVPDPHADFAVRHVGTGGFGCRDSADTRYNLYVADGGVATLYSALVIQGNGSPTWALDVTGPVRLSGSLTIGGDLVVGGNTTMNGGLGVFGLATLHSGLDVTGLATLHTGLAVTGASTFNGAITQQGGMVEFDYPDHTLYVDYPGNEVGIGTNTPGSKLDIVQNAGDASLTVRATNQGTGAQTQTQFRAVNAQGAFAYEGMTDGGYTSFAPINGVAGKGSGFWLCYNAARAVFGCQDTGEIQFSIGGGTVGRFDSIGRMAVGASPPSTSYTLHVQGPLGVTGLVSALAGLTANGLITGTAGLTISGGASSLAAQVRVDTTAAVGTHKLVVWGTGAGASGAVTTAAELGIYGSTGATLMAYASPVEVALQAAAAGTVGRVGSTTNHSFQLLANGTPALVVVPQASGAVGLTVQQQTSGNVGATLFAGGDLVVGDSSHGGFAVPNLSRVYVAYTGAGQSLTANAFTQIQFGAEEKDQRSEYSSNQFQALGTGCYHAEVMLSMGPIATAGDRVVASFFKNGAEYRRFADFTGRNTTDPFSLAGAMTCDLVATDTLDVRVYCYTHGQTTSNTFSAQTVTWFTISKIA